MDEGLTAWRELLGEAVERLSSAGIENAPVDARRIVEEAAGFEPRDFHAGLSSPATEGGVARFDRMVARRLAGEPLQYVIGRWGFRSLDLMVDARVLVPRPETEVVAGLAIAEIVALSAATEREVLVADLGTGSGAIALSVAAECPRTRVMATDRSPEALAVARANLAGIGRAATRVTLHEGSWFDALPGAVAGSLDVVVSNPPYIADDEQLPEVVDRWEPASALRAGPLGTEDLDTIVDDAVRWLGPDGVVVLEMAPHQTATVSARCEHRGLSTTVHADLSGRERAVVARRR